MSERGLAASTAEGYVYYVRPFVAARAGEDGVNVAGLTPADVTHFVVTTCPGRAHGSAKLTVTALRSLLRFLQVEGLVTSSLADSDPLARWEAWPGERRDGRDD